MAARKEHTVSMTFDELKTAIVMKLPPGTTLTNAQEIVIKGTWEGKTFKELADEHEYDFDYLRSIAAELWSELSTHYGQAVGKRNLLAIIGTNPSPIEAIPEITQITQTVFGTPAQINGFSGRELELTELCQQVASKRCIIVSGPDGVGKTSLISKLFELIEVDSNHFNLKAWLYSEGKELEHDIEQFFGIIKKTRSLSTTKSFIEFLKYDKSVIFMDEVDSWLKDDSEKVKSLIKEIVQIEHDSCVVLSVKNSLRFGQELQDNGRLIHNCKLGGLTVTDARFLFKSNGIEGSVDDLIEAYRGVPKYLLYACKMIKFLGSIENFKKDKTLYLTESDRTKLETMFSADAPALSDKEQVILFYIYKHIKKDIVKLNTLIEVLEKETDYRSPLIYTGLRTLERKSIITISDSSDLPNVLLHREFRGYLDENPDLVSSLSQQQKM